MNTKLKLLVIVLSSFILSSCCNLFGSQDLGNNFVLLDGDRDEDRVVIYCPPNKKSECCNGGPYIIPRSYEDHMKDGKYHEYVEKAMSNKEWIVVKSIIKDQNEDKYWIVNKQFVLSEDLKDWPLSKAKSSKFDSLINSKIVGPLDLKNFNIKKQELNINLNFD